MRWIAGIGLAALVVALQTAVAGEVQIGPIRPDWPFLLVVAFSLTFPSTQAMYASAMVGLFVDLNSVIPLGVFTFAYGAVSLLIVQVRELLFRESLLTYALVTLVGGLLVQFVVAALGLLQEGADQYEGSRLLEGLAIAAYTAVWSFPGHWLFLKVRRVLGLSRKRRSGYSAM